MTGNEQKCLKKNHSRQIGLLLPHFPNPKVRVPKSCPHQYKKSFVLCNYVIIQTNMVSHFIFVTSFTQAGILNPKFVHPTDFFTRTLQVVPVTNMRYAWFGPYQTYKSPQLIG